MPLLQPQQRKLYRHYKGGLYVFLGDARLESDGMHLALYQSVGGALPGVLFARPFDEFHELVPSDNGGVVRRFTEIGTLP